MSGALRLIRDKKLTLATLLDELLPLRADRLVSLGEEGGPPQAQRFADLYLQACAMSRFLAEETGLRRGDRVAIFKTNDVECFRWFLAVIRAGGIAVPLNPMLTLP
jgi:long-chain acyl-CoA synthetase